MDFLQEKNKKKKESVIFSYLREDAFLKKSSPAALVPSSVRMHTHSVMHALT